MDKDPETSSKVELLAKLLVMNDQIKNISNIKEFGYFATNESHRLINYNTAYLWKISSIFKIEIIAQSETPEIDTQSPVILWLTEVINEMVMMDNVINTQPLSFMKETIEENQNKDTSELNNETEPKKQNTFVLPNHLEKLWPEHLPKYVLWVPFVNRYNKLKAGLILFRETPFSEQEAKIFQWLANSYQYTWGQLNRNILSPFIRWIKNKPYLKIIILIAIVSLAYPVRISTTATAFVESSDQALISAQIPGIIKEFLIKPGETVYKGQLLVKLDKTELEKSFAVIQKKVMLSQAKLRSAFNQGYEHSDTRNEIPILSGQLAIDQSELDYTNSMLSKTEIRSPINGVAIFESKEDWIGQPVQAGENIMTISNLEHPQLKISLLVADLISLKEGSKGDFYVYGKLSSIPVTLSAIGYSAKLTPNKVLAYQYIAQFDNPKTAPMIGSQGVVHLYGERVPFIYYLLRRPLQGLRQTIGF